MSTAQSASIWQAIRDEATAMIKAEPALAGFLQRTVLHRNRFEDALISHLSSKLAGGALDEHVALDFMTEAISKDPDITA